MSRFGTRSVLGLLASVALAPLATAANHREAPITALDHKADITDVYAFVSYAGQAPSTPPTRPRCLVRRSAARARQRADTFPFDPRHPLRDQDRQQQDARADVDFPVPLQH